MPRKTEDPALRQARREAAFVLLLWAGALTYTVVYCTRYGYDRSLDSLTFVLGFPDWVFWGIVVPWALCLVVSCLFAAFFMRDEDLGEDAGEACDETGIQGVKTGIREVKHD
jgi:hypothetical protein